MRDKTQKRRGRGKTGRRRKETKQTSNQRGKQAQKLEFGNGQEMKTNGPVLCVEDLRLAAHRRLPLSASANKKSKNGGKAEATMEGKRSERVREGTGKGVERGAEDLGAHLWVHPDEPPP